VRRCARSGISVIASMHGSVGTFSSEIIEGACKGCFDRIVFLGNEAVGIVERVLECRV